MALTALAKRLFRTLARVIPQCGMVSQAVAFNMFLAFFAVLLTALSLMKSSLEGEGGQQVAMRISAILPPGSWQLISAYVLRQEVNTWYLALIGWVGTLLVGSQMIKLMIKGIELIYGDHGTHSFLSRQIRGLLLFSFASVAWVVAVALSVFGRPLGQWITSGIWQLFVGSQLFDRHASSHGDDSGNVCPCLDLSCCATRVNNLEVRSARSGWRDNPVVGRQFAIRNLRSEDPIWACLRWLGRGDRIDGMDGNLCDAFLCWCGLELRKCYSGRLRLHHWRKNISGQTPNVCER